MDNHYVPNLTFGPMICQALKPHAKTAADGPVPMDVHLMVQPVDALAAGLCRGRCRLHQLSPRRHRPTCTAACRPSRPKGCKAGLVFNPAAPLDVLDWVIDDIDLILIMSVNPGFGGQSFIDSPCARSSGAQAH
jgi:ribulose-phosphate 3-epimerase